MTARESDHVNSEFRQWEPHCWFHGEFVLALEMGSLLEDIAEQFTHPTMSEAFHEGVLKTLGMPSILAEVYDKISVARMGIVEYSLMANK